MIARYWVLKAIQDNLKDENFDGIADVNQITKKV